MDFILSWAAMIIVITAVFKVIDIMLAKKIGGVDKKIKFSTKSSKRMAIGMLALAGFFILAGALILITMFDVERSIYIFAQGLVILTLNYNLEGVQYAAFGSKGFRFGWAVFYWENIERIDWDKDIGQGFWGFRIITKHRTSNKRQKAAERQFIPRAIKEQTEEEFNKYLQKQSEKANIP